MNTFNCNKCDSKFGYKYNLTKHMKNKHVDENDNDSENSDDKIDSENSDDDENDDHNNENSNKDVNESDKDCENSENSNADDEDDDDSEDGNELEDSSDEEDADDEDEPPVKRIKIDDNYEVWESLYTFINDPEKLQDKYIMFRRLLIKAKNDYTFKVTMNVIDHFKKIIGFDDFVLIAQCVINILKPYFQNILNDDDRDEFWEDFLKVIDDEKLLIKKYEDFLELTHLLKKDKFNKKIVKAKNKCIKKLEMNEIDAFKRVVTNEATHFKKIEENLNNESDVEDDENIF